MLLVMRVRGQNLILILDLIDTRDVVVTLHWWYTRCLVGVKFCDPQAIG